MNNEVLGVGIIGCGAISKVHLEAIHSSPNLKLIGVTDQNKDVGVALASRQNCKFYENNFQLISDPQIQLVVLLTPPGYHSELIPLCAVNKKHILAEKPVGVDLKKAEDYIKLCGVQGVVLSIMSQHRFDPASIFLKQKIEENRFGRITGANCIVNWYRDYTYFNAWRSKNELAGGGVLTIQAIHTIDLMLWCLGEVDTVQAYMRRTVKPEIDVEETAMACLKFKSGALAVISGTTGAYPGYPTKLDIFGRNGSLTIEGDLVTFYQSRTDLENAVVSAAKGEAILDPGAVSADSVKAQYEDVIRSIWTKSSPIVSGKEAARTYAVIKAIYESASRGEEVAITV